jgi:hypothetical protein
MKTAHVFRYAPFGTHWRITDVLYRGLVVVEDVGFPIFRQVLINYGFTHYRITDEVANTQTNTRKL